MTLELYYNTELGAVIDRNKDTRCIAICIAIQVFNIAIRFVAYHCTPTCYCDISCFYIILLCLHEAIYREDIVAQNSLFAYAFN